MGMRGFLGTWTFSEVLHCRALVFLSLFPWDYWGAGRGGGTGRGHLVLGGVHRTKVRILGTYVAFRSVFGGNTSAYFFLFLCVESMAVFTR